MYLIAVKNQGYLFKPKKVHFLDSLGKSVYFDYERVKSMLKKDINSDCPPIVKNSLISKLKLADKRG